jgi:molybdopterin synthase sulfur carrier subunit
MAIVYLPALLYSLTGGVRQQTIDGATVGQLVDQLDVLYPGIKDRLVDGRRIRSGLTVFVDGLVRREGLEFEVSPGSEVHFIPAVAGGSGYVL